MSEENGNLSQKQSLMESEEKAHEGSGKQSQNEGISLTKNLVGYEEGAPEEKKMVASNKSIGLVKGVSFVFGSIIGSGIFISVSETFRIFSSNNIISVILVWLLGGLIAMTGSLCYAELGGRLPQTGGECVYYNNALSKKFSVLFAIMYVFVVKTITIAAISLTAAKYFVHSIPIGEMESLDLTIKITAIIIILICMIINCITKKAVTDLSVVFLVLKMLAVGAIVCPGIYSLFAGKVQDWVPPIEFTGFDFSALSMAIVNVCWSFEGWNSLGLVAGEIEKPSTLLLSSIIGVSLVVTAYVLTVVSYSTVLGFEAIRYSETVALSFAKEFYGKHYYIISILITLSAIGSINGTFYTLGGVTVYSGFSDILPKSFALVTSSTRIPVLSLVAIAICSLGFVFVKFQVLLQYCAFVTWVFYFLSFLSLCLLKARSVKNEKAQKIFHMHYAFIIPAMLVCVYMVGASFSNSLVGCCVIGVIMAFIFFIQYLPLDLSKWNAYARFSNFVYDSIKNVLNLEPAVQRDIS